MDLGGQWVHGTEGNVVYQLAHPLGVLDVSDKPNFGLEQEYLDSLGNHLDEAVTKNVSDFYFKYVENWGVDTNMTTDSLGEHIEKM